MCLDVTPYLCEPIGHLSRSKLRESQLSLDDDTIISKLTGTIDILRTDGGVLVALKATGLAREVCSRCLIEIDHPLQFSFQEEYLLTTDIDTNAPIPIPDDTDSFLINSDFVLDLNEAMRQYRLTAKPVKPLCRLDCTGLCPHCGSNLNEGPCNCLIESDSRWNPLAELADSLKGEQRR